MMYCEHCNLDLFGGSRCHSCGDYIIPKPKDEGPKVAYISSDVIMRRKKRIRTEKGQTLPGRIIRLAMEIAIFCALFFFASLLISHTANWLTLEMSMEPEKHIDPIDLSSNVFKYFKYVGFVVVTVLTIKFRFKLE